MKIDQLKSGVLVSYATQGINILSGLIYTPIMLRILGRSEYGLYQLVYSVVSYLSLLSMGFASSYIRFYSKYKTKYGEKSVAKLNGMFFTIFCVIAAICLVCGGAMTIRADLIFGGGLTPGELWKSRILMAIMVVNMALSFINSAFTCHITSHEKFFFQRIVEFFRALMNPFLTLPLLLMGYGSVGMVMVTTFLTISVLLMNIVYCFKKLKIQFYFHEFDFGLLKEMWVFTFFIFVNMIVDQINWSLDKFLLGRIVGTSAVALYGVAAQLNTIYLTVSTSISSVFIPRINFMVAKENSDRELTELFTKVGRIQFIVLGMLLTSYILFGREFIGLWAGSGYGVSYQIGLFLLIPVTIPLIQNLGIEIQRAKNLHQFRSIVYLIIAVSNIFVSIPCIRRWGAEGAAVGTMITLLIGNGLIMNIYYHKKIGLNIFYYWKEILKFTPSIAVAVVTGILIKKFLPVHNTITFILVIAVYVMSYAASMWLIGMNESEKNIVKNPLMKR
ncbi:MAG: polysaccharide biosynthesis protein [Oscillospiraceae bacterium]|nr:polysaccharide biosynthesis protein [Oscillospiraceae bacterium]